MRAVIAAACVGLFGCTTTGEPCLSRPNDPLCQNVDSGGGDDGGVDDTGVDAPMGDAHVPCGGSCNGSTPHCLATGGTEMCVGCTGDGDCTTAGATHCEPTSHTCVGCVENATCTDVAASLCGATHECIGCSASPDCTHLTGTEVCDTATNTCVECTATDETACGANSCDPATGTCTSTPRGSVRDCGPCVADSECRADSRCVLTQFMGADRSGGYCLPQMGAPTCTRPFTVPTPARASLSGLAAAVYCGINEDATTCEAVLALIDDTACTMPSDCGAPSVDDGRCETVGVTANRCTYSCGTASDCPSGKACGAGYCGS